MFETTIAAFVDEIINITKIASAAQAAQAVAKPGFIRRNAKPLAWMAAGAGAHSVGQTAYNDYRTGRMIRKQNDAAQNMY